MKKTTILLLTFLLTFISANTFSQSVPQRDDHHVSIDIAKQIAIQHYFTYCNLIHTVDYNDIHFSQEKIVAQNSDTLYYIFNCQNNNGFVIVSADFRVQPILGYSFDGSIDENDSNPGLNYFLDSYKEQIQYVKKNNLPVDASIQENWNDYFQSNNYKAPAIASVPPLLTTKWAQGCYYNASCPSNSGGSCGRALVGCVAIQMGQIMKYWNYPTTGMGIHTDANNGSLTVSPGTTTYNWSSMPNTLSSANTSVATLLFHCGVTVDMSYGGNSTGSAALSSKVRGALITYFKYSNQAAFLLKSNYTTTAWNTLLKNEIDNARPVAYRGEDINGNGGHAFVLDGYQGSSSFHFNFGWGGTSNGYFYVNDIYPVLGSTTYHFNNGQSATIKIFPNYPPPPVPTLSSNTCGPKTLTRSSPPSGAIYYWQGTTCGTTTSLGSASNFTVTTSGTYYLRAKYTNGGWSPCISKAVTINPLPGNPPVPATTNNPCGSQTLTRGAPPSGVTFYWQDTICGTSTGNSSLTYAVSSSGTYNLRARTGAGCWSNCTSINETINPIPTPSITGQNSVCSNSSGTIYSVINSGNNFSWTISGGTIASGQNTNSITVNWGTAGTGTATITETVSSTGCSNTVSLNVNINSSLNPTITASGSINICLGQSVMLDASAGFVSYLWSNGDTTQTITVSNSGIFSVSVTGDNGCTGSSLVPITVTVNPNPSALISPADVTFCEGDTVVLTTPSEGIATYSWSNGEITQNISISDSGSYFVIVTDTNGCFGTSTATSVIVNPLPPVPYITVYDDTLISSSASGNQWYINDALIPGATTQYYTVIQNGSYSVSFTDSTFGCYSLSDTVNLNNVSVESNSNDQQLTIYPNPATSVLHISYDNLSTKSFQIKLISLNGQLIYQENLNSFKGNFNKEIDMQNIPRGMYFVKIITDKNVIVKKVVKK